MSSEYKGQSERDMQPLVQEKESNNTEKNKKKVNKITNQFTMWYPTPLKESVWEEDFPRSFMLVLLLWTKK